MAKHFGEFFNNEFALISFLGDDMEELGGSKEEAELVDRFRFNGLEVLLAFFRIFINAIKGDAVFLSIIFLMA